MPNDKVISFGGLFYKYNCFRFVKGLKRGEVGWKQKRLCKWDCIFIEILVHLLPGPILAEAGGGPVERGGLLVAKRPNATAFPENNYLMRIIEFCVFSFHCFVYRRGVCSAACYFNLSPSLSLSLFNCSSLVLKTFLPYMEENF
jgi:hypothetical protein